MSHTVGRGLNAPRDELNSARHLRRIAWIVGLAVIVASLAGDLSAAFQFEISDGRGSHVLGVLDGWRIGPSLLPTPPLAPQDLQAAAGDGQVTLTWNPPSDDGGAPILLYSIYRGTTSGGESFLIDVPLLTTYLDVLVSNGVTYYYQVSATNVAGEGAQSNEASASPNPLATVPGAPQGLEATAGNGIVALAWSPPGSDGGSPITNYRIYRGFSSSGESFLTEVGIILAYSDSVLDNGVTYFYQVTAVNAVGEGAPSTEASATPTAPPTGPSAPQNLQATPGDAQVTLDWQPPASDGGAPILLYSIFRGTSSDAELLLITVPLVTAYTDATASNGVTYYYQVSATNAVGEGPQSNEASATPSPPATTPGAPQGLSATAGDATVSLSWSAPNSNGGSAITNYKVYRGQSSGGEVLIATIGDVLSYSDTGRTNGQTYYYQVSAVNNVGEGPRSNEASATPVAPPGAPQGLSATAGDATVALAWSAPSSNGGSSVTNYKIFRGTSSNGETLLTTVGDVLSYADTTVDNGVTYYYKVSAVNAAGEGPRSNEASATPIAPTTVPGAPRDLGASAGDSTVSLSWSPPASNGGSPITNYKIYRGATSGGESFLITVPNVLSYTDSGRANGQTYYYQVTAVNGVGEGARSNEASATPTSSKTVPSPPRALSAVPGDGTITLTWLAPSSNGGSPITNYKIYRGTTSGGESLRTTIGNVSSYTDTSVTNGVTYYYVVKAVNEVGGSADSNEASAMPTAGPSAPDAPRNLQATPGNGAVTLTWSAPSSDGGSPITGYTLYRGTNSGNRSDSISLGVVTSYTDGKLSNGQKYYYVVAATNVIGEGPASSEVSARPATVPDPPTNLEAIPGSGSVTIQWSSPWNGGAPITNYKIYRGTTSGSTSLIATVGNVDSYSDTGRTNGVRYYYRVAAVNRVGDGAFSNEASAVPTAGPSVPGMPRSLQATAGSGVVTLSWSAPAADGGAPVQNYTVYRGVSPSSLEVLISAKALSLFDGGLTNGVTYYYAVAAVNGVGEGPRSAPVSATPKASGPGPDTTKPLIGIIFPVAGATLAPGPTTITGNASDDVGLSRVEVSPDGTNWTVASGTATWNATINLTVGDYTIYARATDGAGNSATATVTVTVSANSGTAAAGNDLPRSLIITAVLSFAVAAGGAWFLLDRRRKGTGAPSPVKTKAPLTPASGILGRWRK